MERTTKERAEYGRLIAQGKFSPVQVSHTPRFEDGAYMVAQRKKLISFFGNAVQLQLDSGTAGTSAQLKKIKVGSGSSKTTAEWTEGSLGGDVVGTKMKVENLHSGNVDKGELVGSGPSGQETLMEKLPTNPSLGSQYKYIRGHLLNHNIGGPGEPFNLYPITANANSKHLQYVERGVKKWVLSEGKSADYTVKVTGVDTTHVNDGSKSGYVNATFSCDASSNSGDSIQEDITSEYGVKHD